MLSWEPHRYTAPRHLVITYLTPGADSFLPARPNVGVCRLLSMDFVEFTFHEVG
jgi:hypothetical protein